MEPIELRDLDAARRYILDGLLLQRAVKPTAATVKRALEWAMEIASEGDPLPPIGFVADVGHVALGVDAEQRVREAQPVPGWPPALGRSYEDHVLGKLYADWTFERAGDALRKYKDRDRVRGLAYLVRQLGERGKLGGVLLPPAVIRSLQTTNPDEVIQSAYDGLVRDGPFPGLGDVPGLVALYENLVSAGRRMAELLAPEDILALEQGTAIGDTAHYVGHRQLVQATKELSAKLPARPVKPLVGRKEVPTRVLDEDQYPVGGYTSISTKGSIESLLHSQLAYMEPESPDLFDMKFVRDELFYYSRDENQFLRRRRSFVFVLRPDLVKTRTKTRAERYQRVVLVTAAVTALINKLTEWLSTDAIRFEVLCMQEGGKAPLAEEAALLRLLMREPIERGDGLVATGDLAASGRATDDQKAAEAATASPDAVVQYLGRLSRNAQVHCLAVGASPFDMDLESVVVTELVVSGAPDRPEPELLSPDGTRREPLDGEEPFDVWQSALLRVLEMWV